MFLLDESGDFRPVRHTTRLEYNLSLTPEEVAERAPRRVTIVANDLEASRS
jgi:hypothetical protein